MHCFISKQVVRRIGHKVCVIWIHKQWCQDAPVAQGLLCKNSLRFQRCTETNYLQYEDKEQKLQQLQQLNYLG